MNSADYKFLATQTFKKWGEDNAARLAAALAYYTVFSIPPLLILLLVIAGQAFDQAQVQNTIMNQVSDVMGESGSEAVSAILENASRPGGGSVVATIVGFVTLLFGASGVFGQLHGAMNEIWEVEPKPGGGIMATIKERFFSFTMVLGVGFLLMVSLVVSSVLASLNEFVSNIIPSLVLLAQIVNFVVSFGVITVLFALIFKVVPDVKIEWHDVWIGALVTAFLFTVGKWAIGLYLGNSATSSTYGAAGSLIVILLWVYYSSQILFLGAEFTQVYANKFGSRIVADEGAVSTHEKELRDSTMVQVNERTAPIVPETAVPPLPITTSLIPPATQSTLPDQLKPVEQAVASLQETTIKLFGGAIATYNIARQKAEAAKRLVQS